MNSGHYSPFDVAFILIQTDWYCVSLYTNIISLNMYRSGSIHFEMKFSYGSKSLGGHRPGRPCGVLHFLLFENDLRFPVPILHSPVNDKDIPCDNDMRFHAFWLTQVKSSNAVSWIYRSSSWSSLCQKLDSLIRPPEWPPKWPPETFQVSWWRHQTETFSALLALCAGNSPVTVWTNGWVSSRDAGDLRRHRAHYDGTVMSRHLSCYTQHGCCSFVDIFRSLQLHYMVSVHALCNEFCMLQLQSMTQVIQPNRYKMFKLNRQMLT